MKNFRKSLLQVSLAILLSLLPGAELWSQGPAIPQDLKTGQAARFVLGQANFSDISFGTTQERLGAISGIAIAGDKLIVADSSYLAPPNNNRVLIYNNLKSVKSQPPGYLVPADVVVGQPDFSSSTAGTAANRTNQPVGVASDGVRLFVADWGNNRVLIFNRIPETAGAAADVVVGQEKFDTSDFGAGPQKLRRPNSVSTDGARLIVTDTLNHRVLIYNRIPTQNGAAADVVLGQPNFEGNRGLPAAANTLSSPMSATTDGQRLIISDLGNNRILIYNAIPTQSGAAADVVVGQPDFSGSAAGNTATSLNFPRYAYLDGQRLLIVDSGNNRILIYNRIPTENGVQPDIVLGQADFVGLLESCAASNFAVPYAAVNEGEVLLVSDSFNRRVLGFRPGPGLVALNGVVNAASFSSAAQTQACGVVLPQPPVAPGAIASIFGTNLADRTVVADSLPLPTELGGVRVKFNGIPAPLFFVSPSQVNVQVPFELSGFSASMEVEKDTPNGAVISAAAAVGLANGAPGIFTSSGTGEGLGAIVHADFSPVTEENPAVRGETLTAFATGLGTVDHPVTNGAAALFGATGTVTIGGVSRAGQTVTITINDLPHSYTTVEGDTLDTVASRLAEIIDRDDPNVSATGDIVDFKVQLRARVFGPQGSDITFSASVSPDASLTADAGAGNLVPGGFSIRGTPQPGQTVTITLVETPYSYTTSEGDTLQTIATALASLINEVDPNVKAVPDLSTLRIGLEFRDPIPGLVIPYSASVTPTGTLAALLDSQHLTPGVATVTNTVKAYIGDTTVGVSFAGLTEGAVGLYQVNFTVPDSIQPNPQATLTLDQTLIIFGSVTPASISSNTVEFPIGE